MKLAFYYFDKLMNKDARPGLLLLLCALVAIIIVNSPLSHLYYSFFNLKISGLTIHHWVNDALMTIFFFYIGMEIKKEIVVGELKEPQKAALPILAALGGMVIPALIYYYFNFDNTPGLRGWGIPMATDIAFALGVLSLFGKKIPLSLKVFLLAIAIVDDLGAILVIAFFYTNEIKSSGLGIAVIGLCTMALLRATGFRSYLLYVLVGIAVWYGILISGVHATIAGVLIGLLTPLTFPKQKGQNDLYHPLDDLIHFLHPWVSYLIMPIFALSNAGVALGGINLGKVLTNPITYGVMMGLAIGKPIGVCLFSFLAVKSKLAKMPSGLYWTDVMSVGFFAGIGFTMSIFISNLALDADFEIYSKVGILAGTLISVIIGCFFLYLNIFLKKR